MRGLKLLLLAGLATGGIGLATSAEAACVLKGKGTACKGGLSAMTMLVTDKDWQKKWNTSRDATPQFHTASKLKQGQTATLLTFFAADQAGLLQLSCELTIKEAGGKPQKVPAQLCFAGEVIAGDIYLAGMSVGVEGGDATGTQFTVGLKNDKTGAKLTLKTGVEFAQ
jgi:hypothetical protein